MATSTPEADIVIRGATVVCMDAADRVLHDATIAIAGGRIRAVATDAGPPARRIIEAGGGIVIPAFVNLHAHLAMTLLRGYADDCDLQAFLARVFPAEARFVSPEMVAIGAELALAESVAAGITTSLDMYFHPDVAAQAARRAGLRIANGPVFFSFAGGPDGLSFDERLALADESLAAAAHAGEIAAGRWLCPHSTYTIERGHLEAVRDLAARHGAGISIHAAENAEEVSTVRELHGRRPVELLDDLGMLSARTVLAHGVELSDHEIRRIGAAGASVAHNPLSNMKLASGFAPVPDLVRAGVAVGLGTDGSASSNDLDLFAAMRFAATIHKAHAGNPTVVPAREALRFATIGGARALGLGHELGSIEVGKRADLVLLRADRAHLVPSYDPVSTVVYAAGRGDVRMVLCDGQVVLDEGRHTTIDLPASVAAAQAFASRIAAAS